MIEAVKPMRRTSKYSALSVGLIVLAVILVFTRRDSRRPKTGLDVHVATNTCVCDMASLELSCCIYIVEEGLRLT